MATPSPARNNARDDAGEAPIPPFWQRLNDFFLFPFQTTPLIIAALLSLASYLMLLGPIAALLLLALIALGIAHYAFKIAALASRGVLHSSQYASNMQDEGWKYLPWMLFAVLIVHGMVIRMMASVNLGLGVLANLGSSLLLPVTIMVLIRSHSILAAINPMELIGTIADIGKQYFLLCLFLFMLQMGIPIAMMALLPFVPHALLLPIIFFVGIYFTWVMAALTGYVMYQHHRALGIDLLQNPEEDKRAATAPRERPEQVQARQRDSVVADLVQRGELNEALTQAREWVRTTEQPIADHQRYQRVLLLDDAASGRLAEHTPRYLALLLAERRAAEALTAYEAVQRKLPAFVLNDPASAIALAEQACKHMNTRTAISLLGNFDRRFPNAPEIPKSYELAVRVLKQGLGQGDKALRIYKTLKKRYPDHPSTEEAGWMLRDELKT